MNSTGYTALKARIGQGLGLGSLFSPFDGSPAAFQSLTGEQQLAFTAAVKEYVRTHPTEFEPAQIAAASLGDVASLDTYGVGDALESFAGEIGDQAVSINDNLNPFSAKNRGWVLGAVAVGVLIYFVGPPIIAALRAPTKAAK